MTSIIKERLIFKIKYGLIGHRDVRFAEQKNKDLLTVRNVIKTRIRKNNDSIYVNAHSREIKKWFELRGI